MEIVQEDKDINNPNLFNYFFKVVGTEPEIKDLCEWLNEYTNDHSIIIDMSPTKIVFHHTFSYPYRFYDDIPREFHLRMMNREDAILVKLTWC